MNIKISEALKSYPGFERSAYQLLHWVPTQPQAVTLVGNLMLTPDQNLRVDRVSCYGIDSLLLAYYFTIHHQGLLPALQQNLRTERLDLATTFDPLVVEALPQAIPALMARIDELMLPSDPTATA